MKSLNFVDGELSCVGKSLFTCLLIEAYRHFERDYHIVDLDRFNPDVWRRYCRHSDMNGIYFSDDLDELYRTDRLLELCHRHNLSIVKIPQFQLAPAHLTYIANNPNISYGELFVGLDRRGQMLLQAYIQQMFYQLAARISPTLPVAPKLASSAAIEPDF